MLNSEETTNFGKTLSEILDHKTQVIKFFGTIQALTNIFTQNKNSLSR